MLKLDMVLVFIISNAVSIVHTTIIILITIFTFLVRMKKWSIIYFLINSSL